MNVNDHMMHLEDAVFTGRYCICDMLWTMQEFIDQLNKKSINSISIKYDGAPSIIVGINPESHNFFIATKSLFNKTPVFYESTQEIINDSKLSAGLVKKLICAYNYCRHMNIKGIVQGDIMYTASDLKTREIDGSLHHTFHPNTLMYAIPKDSETGIEMSSHVIGIVWHTRYVGNSLNSLSTVKFNGTGQFINYHNNIGIADARMTDFDYSVINTKELETILRTSKSVYGSLNNSFMKAVTSNTKFKELANIYINSFIRSNKHFPNGSAMTDDFIKFVQDRYHNELQKLVSDKAIEKRVNELNSIITLVDKYGYNMDLLFKLHSYVRAWKDVAIRILNKQSHVKTFVVSTSYNGKGLEKTNPEGYVFHGPTAFKFVDRRTFSHYNFSDQYVKGWDSHSRK